MKFSKPIIVDRKIQDNEDNSSQEIVTSIPKEKLTGRDLGDISGLQDEVMTFDHVNLVWKAGDKLNFICNIVSEYENVVSEYPEE